MENKTQQKGYFEYIHWRDISDDPKDDNDGFIYGINLIDEETAEALDSEWFKTAEEREEAISKYNLEEFNYPSDGNN